MRAPQIALAYKSLSGLVLALAVLGLTGCGGRPDFPQWDYPNSKAPPNIVLSGQIKAAEFRNIANEIASRGKLVPFSKWLNEKTDDELDRMGKWITDFLYQDALDPNGSMGILENRIQTKAFTQWREAASTRAPGSGSGISALFSLFKNPSRSGGPLQLLQWNTHWITSDLLSRLKQKWAPGPASSDEMLGELLQIAQNTPELKNTLEELLLHLATHSSLSGSLAAIRPVFAKASSEQLKTFSDRLKHLAESESSGAPGSTKLDVLLRSALVLTESSNGMFSELSRQLSSKPGLIRDLGGFLRPGGRYYQPIVAHSIGRVVRRDLSGQGIQGGFSPGKTEWMALSNRDQNTKEKFFYAVRNSVEAVIGAPLEGMVGGGLDSKLRVYLNTYAITRWLEEWAVSNQATWMALEEASFATEVWESTGTLESWSLSLEKAGAWKSEETKLLDDAIPMATPGRTFTQETATLVGHDALGPLSYSFDAAKDETGAAISMNLAFLASARKIDTVRPFADTSALARSFFTYLSQKGPDGTTPLELFDQTNILDGINQLLRLSPANSTFHVGQVRLENDSIREAVPTLVELLRTQVFGKHPEGAAAMQAIADAFPIVVELGENSTAGPSLALQLYLGWIRGLRLDELPFVRLLLRGFAEARPLSGKLAISGTTTLLTPDHPAIWKALVDNKALAETLKFASTLSREEIFDLEDLTRRSLNPGSGQTEKERIQAYVTLLSEPGSEKTGPAIVRLLSFLPDLTPAERDWVGQFIERDGLRELGLLFSGDSGSVASFATLFQELKAMSKKGELLSAFRFFLQIRDDRIRRMGRVLSSWVESGQFGDFLAALEESLISSNN